VLLSAVLGCGSCANCRRGHFGAPAETGAFDGLHAEYARVPYAQTNLFHLPDSMSDDKAIPLSDLGGGQHRQGGHAGHHRRVSTHGQVLSDRHRDEQNLRINMGNGDHPRYIPKLLDMVKSGVVDPEEVLTQHEPLRDILAAYKEFELRSPGWLKVAVNPRS
jgi:threonine dehydrogenase-like Zn-dependent dehydrogenase